MIKRITMVAVGITFVAAAAFSLPAELVAISQKEVRPDDREPYYLGRYGPGYLYNGTPASLARVAPYRILDRNANRKDYYIVWAAAKAAPTPAAFAHLGAAVRLAAGEILVGLEEGFNAGDIRAVDRRLELIRLVPVTPVGWKYPGEPPPTGKDPEIEAAINTITQAEYAGYVQALQDYRTRYTFTSGCEASRDYVRNFFATQGLTATLFEFDTCRLEDAYYRAAGGNIYFGEDHSLFRRSRNGGNTWETVRPAVVTGRYAGFWLDNLKGFAAAGNKTLAKTLDGGDSWTTVTFGQGHPSWKYYPYSCYFVSENVGWLGGMVQYGSPGNYGGFLIKTSDGGQSWTEQNLPEHFRPGSVAFYDALHGWAGNSYTNYKPAFIYTADGGNTWLPSSDPVSMINRLDIAPLGAAEAWAADRTGMLLHTTDGINWTY